MPDNVHWQQNSTHDVSYNKESDMSALNDVPMGSFIKDDGKEHGEALNKYYEQYNLGQTPAFKLNWSGILIGFLVLGVVFFVGRCEGAKSESLKQQYKAKEDSIQRVYDIKKSETDEVLSKSKNSVTRAENIQRSIPKFAPIVKDTTDDYKKEYIKKFEP